MLQRSEKRYPIRRRAFFDEINALIVLNGVILLSLIVLTLGSPSASQWMTAAAQAEMIGGDLPSAPPTQLAQPAMSMRSVRTN